MNMNLPLFFSRGIHIAAIGRCVFHSPIDITVVHLLINHTWSGTLCGR